MGASQLACERNSDRQCQEAGLLRPENKSAWAGQLFSDL